MTIFFGEVFDFFEDIVVICSCEISWGVLVRRKRGLEFALETAALWLCCEGMSLSAARKLLRLRGTVLHHAEGHAINPQNHQ